MKTLKQASLAIALLAALALLCPTQQARAELKPKIDNFYFLIDTSGSMGANFQNTGKSKYELARELAMKINALIPELSYKGALATMAPFELLQPLAPYSEGSYAQSLNRLPESIRYWFGNPTPLGEGLAQLKAALPEVKANQKTALILFSDGGSNKGRNPVPMAKGIYKEYDKDICFHVISFAENAKSQAILDSIAALSDCTLMAPYAAIKDDFEMKDFVKEVFYTDVAAPVLDSDMDGVIDEKDHCPGTPLNVNVDVVGCPKDTDKDGVYDHKDLCPDTPAGLKVDEKGCAKPVTFDLSIQFDLDKSTVKPQYRDELEKVADFIKDHPGAKAVVEGHTDASGDAAYNLGLSQRRADAVMDYLVNEFGVNPGVITAKGYGENMPVQTNDTKDGRKANRRVQVVVSGFEQR